MVSLVWFPWVFCKWRYNVFNLSRDLARPPHSGVMQIYRWKFFAVYYHVSKFDDHRHCDSRDKVFNLSRDLT